MAADDAISDPGFKTWRCGDGSVETYGIRKIETSCSNYTFSNTLNNKIRRQNIFLHWAAWCKHPLFPPKHCLYMTHKKYK